MPIRINLLSEALAEEELRRKDPVKRAIYGGAFAVVLSLVWFSSTSLEYMVRSKDLSTVQAQIQANTNDYAQVQTNLKKIDDVQHRMAALDQLSAARFLQGNLLNALQQTYVPNVQLTQLRVDQSYSMAAGVPPKAGVTPGRPATITEHITLTLDAKDTSPNPGDQIPHYKEVLLKQDYFNACLAANTNGIRMSGVPTLQTPLDGKPFALFSYECLFPTRTQ